VDHGPLLSARKYFVEKPARPLTDLRRSAYLLRPQIKLIHATGTRCFSKPNLPVSTQLTRGFPGRYFGRTLKFKGTHYIIIACTDTFFKSQKLGWILDRTLDWATHHLRGGIKFVSIPFLKTIPLSALAHYWHPSNFINCKASKK
jgi:hypothetical protein